MARPGRNDDAAAEIHHAMGHREKDCAVSVPEPCCENFPPENTSFIHIPYGPYDDDPLPTLDPPLEAVMALPPTTTIYFVGCLRLVKIGHAKDVKARLRQLWCDNPLGVRLYATMPGTVQLEQAIHQLFHEEHWRAEWFIFSERIDRFLTDTDGMILAKDFL